jgi:hypothetical protein
MTNSYLILHPLMVVSMTTAFGRFIWLAHIDFFCRCADHRALWEWSLRE